MSLPRRLSVLTALALPVAAAVVVVGPQQSAHAATPWPGHPDRSLVSYTVRPGDTATGLSVRFHAWTREFVALNGSQLRVGERVRIPVVLSAVRKARAGQGRSASRTARSKPVRSRPAHRVATVEHSQRPEGRGWLHDDLTRTQVRRIVSASARKHGVPTDLALAIAWQESGWQQRRVSSAGALGVMQVMPDTGRWMRWYAGRQLRLRDTHDNVQAGMLTLKFLRANTQRENRAIAAYYQGLGAVREHGMFRDTKQYVRAVRSHEARIARTGGPL
jgi:hypothetical protein